MSCQHATTISPVLWHDRSVVLQRNARWYWECMCIHLAAKTHHQVGDTEGHDSDAGRQEAVVQPKVA